MKDEILSPFGVELEEVELDFDVINSALLTSEQKMMVLKTLEKKISKHLAQIELAFRVEDSGYAGNQTESTLDRQ